MWAGLIYYNWWFQINLNHLNPETRHSGPLGASQFGDFGYDYTSRDAKTGRPFTMNNWR